MPQLIAQYPNIHLIIAGECFGSFEMYQKLIDTLHLSEYITLHLKYIPNTDIPNYFGACDLLVMPYRHMTNSGIENIGHIYANKTLLTLGATS
jgi:glycosyltransferase involved in cell wall biosynthesis